MEGLLTLQQVSKSWLVLSTHHPLLLPPVPAEFLFFLSLGIFWVSFLEWW